jgi:hypothetical protein
MKIRLGFVSNSSSSSFLCNDESFTVAKLKQKLIEAKQKNENVIDVKNFVFNVIDDDYICKNFGLFSFFSKHEEEILGTKKEARHQKILELTKLKEYKDTLDGLIHIHQKQQTRGNKCNHAEMEAMYSLPFIEGT